MSGGRTLMGVSLALSLLGCAAGSALTPRSYQRDALEDVQLRSLTLVTVVAEGVRMEDSRLAVQAFTPPSSAEPLDDERPWDRARSQLVASALTDRLRGAGWRVSPAPVGAEGRPSATLDVVRSTSTDDAVLVVRAVPVDQLQALVESTPEQLIDATGDSNGLLLPTGQGRSTPVPGQVFVGQAFLYDRRTGARLYSQQLPGVPLDRELRVESKLLSYGLTGPSAAGLEPEALEARAAAGFAEALLAPFPAPRDGTEAGAERLASVDVAAETRREAFLDASHLALDVGTGWTFESIEGNASLPEDGTPLPGLNTGAFAPNGAFQLAQLRLSWVTPGGLSFDAFASYGRIPTSFRRRVFADGTGPGNDVLGTQAIQGGDLFGGGLGVGRLVGLAPGVFLHPMGALYAEQWGFDAVPTATFEAGDHGRVGLEARVDLRLLPFDGPFMLRAGVHARFGVDTAGPLFFGAGGSVGVGALL